MGFALLNDGVCPYCDKPVTGHGIVHGGDILHPECYRALGEELEALEIDAANRELQTC